MEDLNGSVSRDVENHIKDTKEALCDIEEDIHRLIKMEEEEEKDMTEGFDAGAMFGALANKGVDPGIIAMMENARKDGSWGDNGMLILLFLLIICGGGNGFWGNRNGFNGMEANNIERVVFNQSNYDTLMAAVGGNREAVAQLAQTLNCDVGQINSALCGVDKQLAVNNGDVKAALMSVENSLASQLSSCCCSTRQLISEQGCSTRAAIQDVRYLISNSQAAQDSLIQSQFANQNSMIQAQHCETLNAIQNGFASLEMRTLQDQNDRLREQIASQSQAAQTAAIIAAINGRNQVAVSGTLNTTAGTWTGNGQISSP